MMDAGGVALGFLLMLGLMALGLHIATVMFAVGAIGAAIYFGMPAINALGVIYFESMNDSLLPEELPLADLVVVLRMSFLIGFSVIFIGRPSGERRQFVTAESVGARAIRDSKPTPPNFQMAAHHAWMETPAYTQQLEASARHLAGVSPCPLPSDRPRPPIKSFRGGLVCSRIPAALAGLKTSLAARGRTWLDPRVSIPEPDTHEQSLQDRYSPHNQCFGCGPRNEKGLRIKSRVMGDEVGGEARELQRSRLEIAGRVRREQLEGILKSGVGEMKVCPPKMPTKPESGDSKVR